MAGALAVEHRATPPAAFQHAREIVRSGAKLDTAHLAGEVGVARATLYRWTGDRNRLLCDVAWAEVASLIRRLERAATGDGVEWLERIAAGFLAAIADNPGRRSFLTLEGDTGVRLVTAPRGGVRSRIVTAVAELIEAEVAAGRYTSPDEPHLIADGIVSLGQRFLYNAGDLSLNPDPQTARHIVQLVLREPAAVRG